MKAAIRISEHNQAGIGGEIQGRDYTVLLLNFLPRLAPDTIEDMQRHLQTDESFVLLQGKAILFVNADDELKGGLEAHRLEVGKVYTVPAGVWHTQSMSEDAKILLVESSGTVAENSPRRAVNDEQRKYIKSQIL